MSAVGALTPGAEGASKPIHSQPYVYVPLLDFSEGQVKLRTCHVIFEAHPGVLILPRSLASISPEARNPQSPKPTTRKSHNARNMNP